MALPIAVEDEFEFGCADSAMQDVDLSFLKANTDFTVTKSAKVKIEGHAAIFSIMVTAVSFAQLKTSVIDGSTIVCTALVGNIQGSSEKAKGSNQKYCLADSDIKAATVASYAGKGSIGTLTAAWTNTSSGASGSESLKFWFKEAGQDKVKCE